MSQHCGIGPIRFKYKTPRAIAEISGEVPEMGMHTILTLTLLEMPKKKVISWRDAEAKADEIQAVLLATHPGFNREAVRIVHFDGTTLFFESAFYFKYYNYYLIFTEHHGRFVYDDDDVVQVRAYMDIVGETKLTPQLEKEIKDEWNLYKTDEKSWWKTIESRRKKEIELIKATNENIKKIKRVKIGK